jgi:hypothetical protein
MRRAFQHRAMSRFAQWPAALLAIAALIGAASATCACVMPLSHAGDHDCCADANGAALTAANGCCGVGAPAISAVAVSVTIAAPPSAWAPGPSVPLGTRPAFVASAVAKSPPPVLRI